MKPVRWSDNDGKFFQLNTVIFTRTEHESVLAEQDRGTVSIVGKMVDAKLHN